MHMMHSKEPCRLPAMTIPLQQRNAVHQRWQRWSLAVGLCTLLWSALSSAQSLVVQTDRWCPYNCEPGSAAPGYVIELLQAIFVASELAIVYEVVPWDRALKNAYDGRAGAVVGASRKEAHEQGLLIGDEPIGVNADCVFVAAKNPLRFEKLADLNGLKRVAIVSGYSYTGAVGQWLAAPENKPRLELAHGDRPAEINLLNLAKGRLDGVIDNGAVLGMAAQTLGISNKVRLAGCSGNDPMYVAFSAKQAHAIALVKQFDNGIVAMRRDKTLGKLLAKYGQKDWK